MVSDGVRRATQAMPTKPLNEFWIIGKSCVNEGRNKYYIWFIQYRPDTRYKAFAFQTR